MSADLLALLARLVLASSAAMLVVLAVREPVRRAFGANVAYAFWLLVPIASFASFLPARRVYVEAAPTLDGVAASVASAAPSAPVASSSLQAPAEFFTTAWDMTPIVVALWAAGFVLSLAMLFLGQQRLLAKLGLRRGDGDVQIAEADLVGPAVVGVVAPRIVVPADFEARYSELERKLVLEHERAHIRAGDVQINALAAFTQCAMWFNPIVYAARAALRIDQELACDERVMRRHVGARRIYAEAMLKTQLAARAIPLGCAWPPVGAGPLKQRIAMLGRPRLASSRRLAGALVCALATGAAGVAAWAAQPAQVAYADQREPRGLPGLSGARLVQALMDGDTDEARALIAAGADVNHWSMGDGTPLIAATRLGDSSLVALLIQNGADVNKDAHGEGTPLIAATRGGDPSLVTLLLENGADANQPSHGDGTPLIAAASSGDTTLLAILVEAGANVNGYIRGDETPLINAARHGRLEAARFLIEHGADVNLAVDAPTLRGMERRSPLSMAERGGHADVVRLLRNAGARN